jgi:hypothetical protein
MILFALEEIPDSPGSQLKGRLLNGAVHGGKVYKRTVFIITGFQA